MVESKPVDLSTYVGKNIRLRFHFDTLDAMYNKGLAWAITAMRISDDPTKVCTESADDGTTEKAREIALGGNMDGQICPTGDVDFFSFTGENKQTFSASVNLTSQPKDWEPTLTLLSGDGKSILVDGRAAGNSVQLNTILPGAGRYYLKIGAQTNNKVTVQVSIIGFLIQDTTPPTVKLTTPSMFDQPEPASCTGCRSIGWRKSCQPDRVLCSTSGTSVDNADRVSVDETGQDGWIGSIPADYTGKLEGAAIFARAFDQAGNHTDSSAVILAGDGSTPVTHMDARQLKMAAR